MFKDDIDKKKSNIFLITYGVVISSNNANKNISKIVTTK